MSQETIHYLLNYLRTIGPAIRMMQRAGLGLARPLMNYQSTRAASLASVKDLGVKSVRLTVDTLKGIEYKKFAVELAPPTPFEIKDGILQAVRLVKSSNWKNLTVREAWLNTLVATEVVCWFFVGEVIGKGTLIGYQV